MRVRLAVAALVNNIIINVQANMAAEAPRINNDIFFTNRILLTIHSESVPRSRSKSSTVRYAERNYIYSLTCIQRPPKESNKNCLLQQVVFKCRFY